MNRKAAELMRFSDGGTEFRQDRKGAPHWYRRNSVPTSGEKVMDYLIKPYLLCQAMSPLNFQIILNTHHTPPFPNLPLE